MADKANKCIRTGSTILIGDCDLPSTSN